MSSLTMTGSGAVQISLWQYPECPSSTVPCDSGCEGILKVLARAPDCCIWLSICLLISAQVMISWFVSWMEPYIGLCTDVWSLLRILSLLLSASPPLV